MTALTKFARLEASALWRPAPGEQRREVIVSLGDATLMISDLQDRALTHWSLAAVTRANPGRHPAIFHPDGDPGETIEFPEDETELVAAIEKLRSAVARARPRPGRLRGVGLALSLALMAGAGIFWLPGAVISHAAAVVPAVKRAEIGDALLGRIERLTGPACKNPGGVRSLNLLRARLGTGPISLMPGASVTSIHLPGGRILIDRSLVEDYEEPDVAAGYILAEHIAGRHRDPLMDILETAGVGAAFRLLTTGDLSAETLDLYASKTLREPQETLPPDVLLPAFSAARLRSTPYAYSRDVTGESVFALIEAEPTEKSAAAPLLSDADWLRLQAICDS